MSGLPRRAGVLVVLLLVPGAVLVMPPPTAAALVEPAAAVVRPAVAVAPAVGLSAPAGPATSVITATARGFDTGEPVDLFAGTHPVGSGTADATGALTATTIRIPAATQPGTIPVVATGRRSHLTASAPFVVRSDWPQGDGGPTHQNWNPFENTLTRSTVAGGLSALWTREGTGAQPVVANGLVIVAAPGGLAAYRESSGALVWTSPGSAGSSAAVAGGVGFVVMDVAGVSGFTQDAVALDVYSGAMRWRAPLPTAGEGARLTVAGGGVYTTVRNGPLTKFDARTGARLWSVQMFSGTTTAPVVAGDLVYVRTAAENLQARSVATGALRWSHIAAPPGLADQEVAAGGRVFLTDAHGLTALDAATGATRWSRTGAFRHLTVTDTRVLVNGPGGLNTIDPATGVTRAVLPAVAGTFLLAGDLLYVDKGESVDVVDSTSGAVLTSLDFRFNPVQSLAVANGGLYTVITLTDPNGNPYSSRLTRYEGSGLPPSQSTLDDSHPAIIYGTGWQRGVNAADFGGSDHNASARGSAATVTFSGTGARLWFSTAPHHGIAQIIVDGRTFTVDEYSAVRRDGRTSWTTPLLAAGTHTLRVVAAGTKNPSATSTVVTVDRVEVGRN